MNTIPNILYCLLFMVMVFTVKMYLQRPVHVIYKILVYCVCFFLPLPLCAAAFLIYNQDAKANGMGMAVSASIDNPSAIFYNPSLLPEQKGFSASFGDTVIIPTTYFRDETTGQRFNARPKTHHLPTLYIQYTRGNISYGLGVYSPFGLSTEWPKGWMGRYVNTFAEIKTTFINPVIAWRFNEFLSFGLGLSYVLSSVSMKNATNLSLFGLPDGTTELSGDGHAFGYNAALTLKLPKDYRVALTYRSAVDMPYEGTAKVLAPTPFGFSTDASTRMTLPFIGVLGIAKTCGPLTIEGDLLYTGWSSLNHYKVKFKNGMAQQFFYKDWFNTPSIAIGVNYRFNKPLEVRAGYMYDKSPVPKRTVGPELPDNTRHIVMGGTTYTTQRVTIDMAYQATFFKKIDASRSMTGLKGTYHNFAHLILIGIRYTQ